VKFVLAAGNSGVEAATNIVVKQAERLMLVLVYGIVALLVWWEFKSHTGAMPNDTWSFASGVRGWKPFPACLGLGFYLRGDVVAPNFLGTLTSPRTYGGAGAGSTMFWVDPERELTCVFLSAGLITCELRNIDRMQRISDLVVSALVDLKRPEATALALARQPQGKGRAAAGPPQVSSNNA
jgi:hypothetical protein